MKVPLAQHVINNIKATIRQKGSSQIKLGKSIDMTQANISRLFHGRIKLTFEHLELFASALDIEPEVFLKDALPERQLDLSPALKTESLKLVQDKLDLFIYYLERCSPEKAERILESLMNLIGASGSGANRL